MTTVLTPTEPRHTLARLLEWVFTVWVVIGTVRYGTVAVRSILHPLLPGNDFKWFVAWAGVMAGFLFLFASRRAFGAIVAASCALALVFLIGSGSMLQALAALWIIGLSWRAGTAALRGRVRFDVLTGLVTGTSIGLSVLALCVWGLGALQLLRFCPVLLLVLSAAAIYFSGFRLWPPGFGSRRLLTVPVRHRLPVLCMLAVFLANLTWAVAPEIQFDSLNYHLSVPRIYLDHGGILNLPYFFHSYFAHLLDYVFLVGLALGSDTIPKLLSLAFGVLAACSVALLARQLFSRDVAVWSAALFYTTPIVSWGSATAYVDNGTALLTTAAIVAFSRWYKHRSASAWLLVAGFLSASAVGAKVNTAFALLVFAGAALFACFTRRQWRLAAGFCVVGVVGLLPWLSVPYVFTGNPIFPMLNGVFRSPMWPTDNSMMNAADFGIGKSPGALLRLPFRFVLDTTRFAESIVPRGSAGIALLIAFPFSIFLVRPPRHRALAVLYLLTGLTYLILWALTFQYHRYYIPIAPLMCVLAVAVIAQLPTTPVLAKIVWLGVGVCLFVQAGLTPVLFWNIPERFPWRLALGRESRLEFLHRTMPGYDAAQMLNRTVIPGADNVLGVDTEPLRFYLKAPLYSLSETLTVSPMWNLTRPQSNQQLGEEMRRQKLNYIFTSRHATQEHPEFFRFLDSSFLSEMTTMVWSDESVMIYRLR